ncbi:immunoglobulin domain-containing protein Bsg [Musca autumnalis]|uniref:immunoglobulin domain-containing protein Bsg n=1 Tax=Musca autumnalis TaxID=221902 RepID=UPI003CF790D2
MTLNKFYLCGGVVNDVEDSTEFEFETALYYGDSTVNVGERFSITCIIPITDPINWLKDDEPIKLHNLRHGHDEHSYVLSESAIEGEKHKIEAHITVRHALKVHEGKYQCNNLHTSYHMLQVRSPEPDKPETLSPFLIQQHHMGGSRNRNEEYQRYFPTESGYVTIHDLTPSQSNEDDLFTRTWEPTEPETPPQILALPTKKPITTTTSGQQQQHHHSHHHPHEHDHDGHLPHIQQMEHDLKHKLFLINTTTNFDGSPVASMDTRYHNKTKTYDLNPPPTPPHYTTESWRPTGIYYAATPPSFPPPRTTPAPVTAAPPPPPPGLFPYYMQPYYIPGYQHKTHDGYHMAPGSPGGIQQAPPQYHMPPNYFIPQYISPSQQQHPHPFYNPMVTFPSHAPGVMSMSPGAVGGGQQQIQHPPITYYPHPFQHYPQMPPNQQYMPMPVDRSVTAAATSAPIFAPGAVTAAAAVPGGGQQQQQQLQQPVLILPGVVTQTMAAPSNISLIYPPLPVNKEQEFLVPNYDNVEQQLKVYDIRAPLVLSCEITGEGNYELTWERNGTEVSKVKELEGRYRILAAERKFIIEKTDVHDDGLYSCVANNVRKDFNVVAKIAVRVPSNSGVVEGEKLSIVCTVVGTNPQLSWSFGNLTINNSTGRYILRADDNKIQNAILTIENVSLDDRGEYKCIGRNLATEYAKVPEASDTSFVRVKGKFAALWPFLGICAEVLILCTIILIYEKRRNKNVVDDDTDAQDQ